MGQASRVIYNDVTYYDSTENYKSFHNYKFWDISFSYPGSTTRNILLYDEDSIDLTTGKMNSRTSIATLAISSYVDVPTKIN